MTGRIAVFARPPVPGEAKTRLTPSLPAGLAAMLHGAMIADTLETALQAGCGRVTLYWAPTPARPDRIAVPAGVEVRHQRGADLGERLATAFGELLAEAGDRAVVVGTDCPDLAPQALRAAFAALEEHDLVLGPARDGGYYLIGLARPAPPLFEGVAWGTGRVLTETLERASRMGLGAHRMEALEDLDTPDDLVRFLARRSVSNAATAIRTEAALREMGLLPPRGPGLNAAR